MNRLDFSKAARYAVVASVRTVRPMKRECGEGPPKSAAAPATVSGERCWHMPLWNTPREGPTKQ
jgi:hypothetical protein